MFAATCIGVALLVVLLEFFRRMSKEYDVKIVIQFKRELALKAATSVSQPVSAFESYRVSILQQIIRAALHAVVFGLAYIVMLLAMYYNGFILFSIFIGAFLGKFFCDWMVVKLPIFNPQADISVKDNNHQIDEPSVCCG